MKKQGFVKGAVVLAAASVACKIISALFKIPLDRFFLHEDGIAVFQSACSVYNVFLAICVTGIPVALSSVVAKSNDEESAVLVKSTAVTVTAFCALCAVVLFVFAPQIALIMSGGDKSPAGVSLRISALGLLPMGIICSSRGFFQGKSNMTPSALSQLAESLSKAVIGIGLCAVLISGGIAAGSAGAMGGTVLGAYFSALVLYIFTKRTLKAKGRYSLSKAINIIKLSIPFTLGTFGLTMINLCDSLTVTGILAQNGVELSQRLNLFGYLSRAFMVYNLPATIITAVAMSSVPQIASAIKNGEATKSHVQNAVKFVFLVAAPCAFGLMFFAAPIFTLLFNSAKGSSLLALIGVSVLIIPYIQATTAMLQTKKKVWQPIAAAMISIAAKLGGNFLFIKYFGINGAMYSTIAAFLIAFAANTFMLRDDIFEFKFLLNIVKTIACAAIGCAAAAVVYRLRPSLISLCLSIATAAVIYAVLVIVTGAVVPEEIKTIGRKER